jgi:NOL1/NOP2/sun family putative RNA methylase
MRALLQDEAEAFLNVYASPPRSGLRINSLKISAETFVSLSPFRLESVPWCAEGFVVSEAERTRPGRHPYHAAGLYYLQDASAMAVADLLEPQPGEVVLDLCAAPGGKATHIAARMQDEGLLVANEVVRGRADTLVDNLERFGASGILVVNETPETLADAWPEAFDRVLVDAPCSGEGLFRKNPAACLEWSPGSVSGCALRQGVILGTAADLVCRGGRLVYSTCTFAPEENEAVVARFLRAREDFHLATLPVRPGHGPGRPDWIDPRLACGLPLERCVRIWPHRAPGEGHFIAVLEREGDSAVRAWPMPRGGLSGEASRIVGAFWNEALNRPLAASGWQLVGQAAHRVPVSPEVWRGLRVVRAGLRVGDISRGGFHPAHALAMSLRPDEARRSADLESGSPAVDAYLRGEALPGGGPQGWLLVTCDGFALGWGKRVGGVVKNHYPKRLRWSTARGSSSMREDDNRGRRNAFART